MWLGSGWTSDRVQVLGLPKTEFASVFTHTARSGFKPRSMVRDVEVEPASPLVADRLKVEVGSPVYRYVRTRYVDGAAAGQPDQLYALCVCPGLEHDDVSRYSFQRLLEEKYFAVLIEMQEDYSLIHLPSQDRESWAARWRLGIGRRSHRTERHRLAAGLGHIRIRPDRYEYVAALWPQAAHLLETGPCPIVWGKRGALRQTTVDS